MVDQCLLGSLEMKKIPWRICVYQINFFLSFHRRASNNKSKPFSFHHEHLFISDQKAYLQQNILGLDLCSGHHCLNPDLQD